MISWNISRRTIVYTGPGQKKNIQSKNLGQIMDQSYKTLKPLIWCKRKKSFLNLFLHICRSKMAYLRKPEEQS